MFKNPIKLFIFVVFVGSLFFFSLLGVMHLYYCPVGLVDQFSSIFWIGCIGFGFLMALLLLRIFDYIAKSEQEKIEQIEKLRKEIEEKNRIEKELRLSEERFQLAMAASNDGLFDSNEITDELYYSPRWKSMLGYQENEIGNSFDEWENRLHPDDRDRALLAAKRFVEGDAERFEIEFRMQHKAGHYLNIMSRAFALKDENGKIYRTVGTHRDITALRLAEKTIRESEQKFKTIFENIQIVYVEIGINGKILEISPFTEKLFLYTREEVIGQDAAKFWKNPELIPGFVKKLIEQEKVEDYEIEFLDKNGGIVVGSVYSTLVKDEYEKPFKQVISILDVTNRKNTEDALRESEIRYKSLCDNMKSGVAIYKAVDDGEDFVFIDFNKGAENIEQVDKEVLIGKRVTEVFPGVKELGLFEIFQRVYRTGISDNHPISFYKDNKIEGWRENYVYKLPSGEIVAVYQDETKRRQAEQALRDTHDQLEEQIEERTKELKNINRRLEQEIRFRRETEHKLLFAKHLAEAANKAKSEFLSNISHELRNPMHQILSYSKYGIEKFESVDQQKLLHYFNQIRTSADRLMFLLNDLLDLSKMEAGRMEYKFKNKDIGKLFHEAAEEFNTVLIEKQIKLKIKTTLGKTILKVDPLRIGQVIRNLLSNAIKYSRETSEIEVRYEKLNVTNGENETVLQVFVVDQGVGIPEDELDFVFDKFTQSSKTKTGAGGTGLGLAICREIITAHSGKIWAEHNPAGGSIFIFQIPFVQIEKTTQAN